MSQQDTKNRLRTFPLLRSLLTNPVLIYQTQLLFAPTPRTCWSRRVTWLLCRRRAHGPGWDRCVARRRGSRDSNARGNQSGDALLRSRFCLPERERRQIDARVAVATRTSVAALATVTCCSRSNCWLYLKFIEKHWNISELKWNHLNIFAFGSSSQKSLLAISWPKY